MKNILFIVLDSVTNTQLFNHIDSEKKAPFLNQLRKKSISGDNMYSQAPYTEAALMSLLGSSDTLDKGGYMEKFKGKKTVLDIFNENGYCTFFPTFYPSIYPKYMHYGAKVEYYIEKFTPTHFWDYRFKYYQNLYLNDETTEYENKMLEDMICDNLNAWLDFVNLLIANDEKTKLINNFINRDELITTNEMLKEEISELNKDKTKYLKNLFEQGINHKIFSINDQKFTDKINNEEFRTWFVSNYKKTFDKIKRAQFKKNIRNARLPFKKMFKNINNYGIVKGLFAGYKNLLIDQDLYDRIDSKFDLFKAQRSFRTVADLTIDWIKKQKNKKKPWMAYVHVDDCHYPENFFTYDTDNKNIIREEFNRINNYIDTLSPKYCGTIASDLSLLYCDSIVHMLYDYLEKNNLLDNTSIVITADHGFSYYFNPIREKYVITNYRENYNVPFIVFDKSLKQKKIRNFLTTKDIPATLLDLAKIPIPKFFKGKSLLKYNGKEYATVEYMGGGCPDIQRRPIILGVRTNRYDVISEIKDENIIVKEIYDNDNDIFQNNNLANKNINIDKEVNIIKRRYNEIINEQKNLNRKISDNNEK